MRYILASSSPRRQELFSTLDLEFRVCKIDCEESYPNDLKDGDISLYLAKKKAAAYHIALAEDEVLVTADTIVWVDNRVLGKPKDKEDAKQMLNLLSGKVHKVFTGVCLTSTTKQHAFTNCTEVSFKPFSPDEIDYYINKYSPLDKAGAYGIQEWIGCIGVTGIKGCFYNVMGLPVHALYTELQKFNN